MFKAKFHYASLFGAGSKPNSITLSGSNRLRTRQRNGIWPRTC